MESGPASNGAASGSKENVRSLDVTFSSTRTGRSLWIRHTMWPRSRLLRHPCLRRQACPSTPTSFPSSGPASALFNGCLVLRVATSRPTRPSSRSLPRTSPWATSFAVLKYVRAMKDAFYRVIPIPLEKLIIVSYGPTVTLVLPTHLVASPRAG